MTKMVGSPFSSSPGYAVFLHTRQQLAHMMRPPNSSGSSIHQQGTTCGGCDASFEQEVVQIKFMINQPNSCLVGSQSRSGTGGKRCFTTWRRWTSMLCRLQSGKRVAVFRKPSATQRKGEEPLRLSTRRTSELAIRSESPVLVKNCETNTTDAEFSIKTR